jgi:hypothetical protein
MKKILSLAIFCITISGLSRGQGTLKIINPYNNNVVNDSTLVVFGNSTDEMNINLYVLNSGIDSMSIYARRDSVSLPMPDTNNDFCWVLCYGNTTNISAYTLTLGKGDTANAFNLDPFQGHYWPHGTIGSALIRYTFFPARNHADSSWVIVDYKSTPTSVQSLLGNSINFSAYPNPAANTVNFSYNLVSGVNAANLKIYNLLGECVQTVPLNTAKNKTTLDVQSIPSGIYVCEIEANGYQPSYKKLVVTH